MAWNTTNEGAPYYKPVAPETAQVRPLPQGEMLGGNLLTAMTQAAIARERAQLEQSHQLLQADLAAKQLAFGREKMGQDYELSVRGQDIQKSNIDLDFDIQNRRLAIDAKMNEHQADHLDALTGLADTQAEYYGSALTRTVENAQKRAKFVEDAGKDAHELGLDDLEFQGSKPMQYAKNALGFERIYGGSIDTFIKNKVAEYTKRAQASKVSLPDDVGNMVQYPWSQIVQDIERNSNSPFIPRLQKAGLFDTQISPETVTNSAGVKVPKQVTRKPKGDLKRMLEDTKAGTPIKEIDAFKSKADPFADTSTAIMNTPIPGRKGATPAGMLNRGAELPPPEKSPVEQEAEFVKQKMAADPDNAEAYRATFLQFNPGQESLLQ